MSTADRRTAVGLFLLTFVAYASFFGGAGWNQNANFDLTRAIVERGTIAIDAYAENTGDVSRYGGHVYSNKAPGLSLLAVVPYAVIRLLVDENDPFGLILALWLVTVAVCATSGALLIAAIYVYGRTRVGASAEASLAVALLIAFGTYVFSWSTVFFMHVPSALLLFLAFPWGRERPFVAGLCAGAAGLCNYLCIPAALILLVYAGRRNALRFLAGGAPFAIALLAYQAAAFGSPFTTSIAYTRDSFLDRGAALGVFSLPRLDVLFEILVGRYRGLFFLSPVLAFAFAGAVVMARRRALLPELATIGALVAYFVLANAGFNYWDGGSALGPRHILPIVPLLAVPMFAATALWRPLWVLLGAISFVVNFVATAVNPLPSRIIRDPVGSYLFPLFHTGRLPESTPPQPLWSWKVMLGHVSVSAHAPDEPYPYTRHRPGSAVARWASFNVGEVVFPESRASVIPIAVWILFGSFVLARQMLFMRRLLPLLVVLATVRCATVTIGRYQTVPVESNPPGAAVRVACGSEVRDAGVTPVRVELRRKAETCMLTLTKEGYAPETVTFRRGRSAVVYGNVVPGVLTGTLSGSGAALIAALADASDAVIVATFAAGFAMGVGLPALVDHATGAMYKHHPERVEVTLRASSP